MNFRLFLKLSLIILLVFIAPLNDGRVNNVLQFEAKLMIFMVLKFSKVRHVH